MSCEFNQPSMDGRNAVCKKFVVLREIINRNEIEDIFTPAQLMVDICNNADCSAREQCHAYSDMRKNGRNSLYCK